MWGWAEIGQKEGACVPVFQSMACELHIGYKGWTSRCIASAAIGHVARNNAVLTHRDLSSDHANLRAGDALGIGLWRHAPVGYEICANSARFKGGPWLRARREAGKCRRATAMSTSAHNCRQTIHGCEGRGRAQRIGHGIPSRRLRSLTHAPVNCGIPDMFVWIGHGFCNESRGMVGRGHAPLLGLRAKR